MFAAENLVHTLLDHGVEVCFTNPGTSEMHMVAALDRNPKMRSILCLFEGVASGAADGYARMARSPACTLLHLGPGVGNGLANFHNARKAFAPVVNLVGDHARDHLPLDAPLTSDIEGICRPISRWVETVKTPEGISASAAQAVEQSLSAEQGVTSLIIPADCAWAQNITPTEYTKLGPTAKTTVEATLMTEALAQLGTAKSPAIYIGGDACFGQGLEQAAILAKHFGAKLMMETFPARTSRGVGRPQTHKLNYFAKQALADFEGCDLIVVIGVKPPVSFFAYPETPSLLTPPSANVIDLGGAGSDVVTAMDGMIAQSGAKGFEPIQRQSLPVEDKNEALNPLHVGASLSRHMPKGAIVCDDGNTSSIGVYPLTSGAQAHEWLCLTGGAIGIGLPLAIGAACADPDAQVISLNGDGAAAYTVQALWTQAREGQNIINIIFANHSYRILNIELSRVGAGKPGPAAQAMLDLSNPKMDWVKIGEGFGVSSVRATTAGEFDEAFQNAISEQGPHLIVAEI